MATLVVNLRGATADDRCPTKNWRWFREPYCGRVDYRAWHASARNLYTLGLLPLYEQLLQLAPDATETANTHRSLEDYSARYSQLPTDGSFFSEDKNVESISTVVGLMNDGNVLYDQLRVIIESKGATPTHVSLPAPPAEPRRKSVWSRFYLPGLAVLGTVGLVSLIYVAGRD